MRIVIFGGTTEGRQFSRRLAALGHEVVVSVATAYGAECQGCAEGIAVRVGRLETAEMAGLLAGAGLCVDATHPYAVQASENIRRACAKAGVEYRRLLREAGKTAEEAVVVASAAEAAAFLAGQEGLALLTTGAKELGVFAPLGGERLVARVLPSHESLAACEQAGIPHKNILAMQGPFGYGLDRAVLEHYRPRWLVTKDGGSAGGFEEKLRAAAHCGVGVVVIARPRETGESEQEILAFCGRQEG